MKFERASERDWIILGVPTQAEHATRKLLDEMLIDKKKPRSASELPQASSCSMRLIGSLTLSKRVPYLSLSQHEPATTSCTILRQCKT